MRFIIFLLALTIYSCTNKKPIDTNIEKINIDLSAISYAKNEKEIIHPIKLVKLESSRDAYLNYVNKTLKWKDRYLVLDEKAKTISQFDKSGHFIRKLNKVGKGEGEYIHITDFNINSDSTSYFILDNRSKKLLQYSFSNKYLGRISYKRLTYPAVNYFELLTDSITAFYSISNQNRVVIYNHKTNTIIAKSAKVPNFLGPKTPLNHFKTPFFRIGKKVYYWEMFDKNIYQVNSTGIWPVFSFNFGNKDFLDINKLSSKNSLRANLNIIQKRDWIYGLNGLSFSNNQLMAYFGYKDNYYTIVYDILRKKTKLYRFDIANNLPPVLNGQDNILFSSLLPFKTHDREIISGLQQGFDSDSINEKDNYYILETCLKR